MNLDKVSLWQGKGYFFEIIEKEHVKFKLKIRHDKLNEFFEDYGSLPILTIDLISDHPATLHCI